MSYPERKKLSLSERFGTIGTVCYQEAAQENAAMVNKLQRQIADVMKKRSQDNEAESQAKMISEEVSDIQQRFDDVPVSCKSGTKFQPFKVEIKVDNSSEDVKTSPGSGNYNPNRNKPVDDYKSKDFAGKSNMSKNNRDMHTYSKQDDTVGTGYQNRYRYGKGHDNKRKIRNISKPVSYTDKNMAMHTKQKNMNVAGTSHRNRNVTGTMSINASMSGINHGNRNRPGSGDEIRAVGGTGYNRDIYGACSDTTKTGQDNRHSSGSLQGQNNSCKLNRGQNLSFSDQIERRNNVCPIPTVLSDQNGQSEQFCPNGNSHKTNIPFSRRDHNIFNPQTHAQRFSVENRQFDLPSNNEAGMQQNTSGTRETYDSSNQKYTERKSPIQNPHSDENYIRNNNHSLSSPTFTRNHQILNYANQNPQSISNRQTNPVRPFQEFKHQESSQQLRNSYAFSAYNSSTNSHAGTNFDSKLSSDNQSVQFFSQKNLNVPPHGQLQFGNNFPFNQQGLRTPSNQQNVRLPLVPKQQWKSDGHEIGPSCVGAPQTDRKHSPEEQPLYGGTFGKRLAPPQTGNKYSIPAKKRIITPENEVPSYQNRLSFGDEQRHSSWEDRKLNSYECENYADLKVGIPHSTGRYGIGLQGPFAPENHLQHFPDSGSIKTQGTVDSSSLLLNKENGSPNTKEYLFSRMLDQKDAKKPTENVLKPSGFYQELLPNENGSTFQLPNGKATENQKKLGDFSPEKAELVTSLLTQCQAMAQKNDDRKALDKIVSIIRQEIQPQPVNYNVVDTPTKTDKSHLKQSSHHVDSVNEEQDAKFSPASSSPDPAIKANGVMKFEGRTLLKGGVKPRHIPKTLITKPDEDQPRDPRHQSISFCPARQWKLIDLPLPPYFIDFVATEKNGRKKEKYRSYPIGNKANSGICQEAVPDSVDSSKFYEATNSKTCGTTAVSLCSNFGDRTDLGHVEGTDSVSGTIQLPLQSVDKSQRANLLQKQPSTEQELKHDSKPRDPRLKVAKNCKKVDTTHEMELPVFVYDDCREKQLLQQKPDLPEKSNEGTDDLKHLTMEYHKKDNFNKTCCSKELERKHDVCSPLVTSFKETSGDHHGRNRPSSKDTSEKYYSVHSRHYSRKEYVNKNQSHDSPTKRYDRFSRERSLSRSDRFSRERSLSRSRSSSRSRDGDYWSERELVILETNTGKSKHRNVRMLQSLERYDKSGNSRDKSWQMDRNEFTQSRSERRHGGNGPLSPGTYRYIRRRDSDRSTPPSPSNRLSNRYNYHSNRHRNYSEGSDFCYSPLR